MAKVKLNAGDGDKDVAATAVAPKSSTTQGSISTRFSNGFKKEAVNIDSCGKDFVPMVCNKHTRVGTLTGRVYLFPADKAVFVHKNDESNCAKHGAKVLDAEAIAAIEQAKIDAAELAQFRADKVAEATKAAKIAAAKK